MISYVNKTQNLAQMKVTIQNKVVFKTHNIKFTVLMMNHQ